MRAHHRAGSMMGAVVVHRALLQAVVNEGLGGLLLCIAPTCVVSSLMLMTSWPTDCLVFVSQDAACS